MEKDVYAKHTFSLNGACGVYTQIRMCITNTHMHTKIQCTYARIYARMQMGKQIISYFPYFSYLVRGSIGAAISLFARCLYSAVDRTMRIASPLVSRPSLPKGGEEFEN